MRGIEFKEANSKAGLVFMSENNTAPLPVYTDGFACVSVWELNDEDIKTIVETRKIQLLIHTKPLNHPAVALTVENIIPNIDTIIIPR